MRPGKIPPEILAKIVFSHLGKEDDSVILGPGIGEDAALIHIGDIVLVAAADPITGSIEDVGHLAVHVNANDIATFGVSPRWFLASIMLPLGSTEEEIKRIMKQIDEAAKSLDIAVAGGHTEITERVEDPLIAGFMLGVTSPGEYVTSSGANPDDAIIMTKTVALEGTSILAAESSGKFKEKVGMSIIEEALALRHRISVVAEGIAAFKSGHVTAMHDPTEGGLAGGIHELCDASQVGFELYAEDIPIHTSTQVICKHLGANPLCLIASGTMLITCISTKVEDVINAINDVGVDALVIGKITDKSTGRNLHTEGGVENLIRPDTDALWEALKQITDE